LDEFSERARHGPGTNQLDVGCKLDSFMDPGTFSRIL